MTARTTPHLMFKHMMTALALSFSALLSAEPSQPVDLHFLIPSNTGGGWDDTARSTGSALQQAGLVESITYENISGNGGGKAIAHLIETTQQQQSTLLVNSTPLIVRALTKIVPQSFRHLSPVAAVIGDYSVLAVRQDSPFKNWSDLLASFHQQPRSIRLAGGSVRGSLDHLVAAMIFKAAGENPRQLFYIPYEGGGDALESLLNGDTNVLSTGLGEIIQHVDNNSVRLIAVTSDERLANLPDIPTFKELGVNVEFINWRGFFGPPNLSLEKKQQYDELFLALSQSSAWQEELKKHSWVSLYLPNQEFYLFLEQQERQISQLMYELGFLR